MFNADLALSVTMTAVGTVTSSLMLPANLMLYVNAAFKDEKAIAEGDEESVIDSIDWVSLFTSLAIVIAAISLGLFASYKVSNQKFNVWANRLGSISGLLLVVFSMLLSSFSGDNDAKVWSQHWTFYLGVSLPCLAGLLISTVLSAHFAKLQKPEVVSVGVECCYQNVGIAQSACVSMFANPVKRGQALCVPLFYGVMEAVVLGLYCIVAWKFGWTKAPKDENFCVMITKTYEVEDNHDSDLERLLYEEATEALTDDPDANCIKPIV